MVKIYSVKVINPSKISQSIKIANPGKGETVIIRAESGDKFQLIEEQSANSPHKVFVKRVEDNLYVLFEEGNIQKPDLIIEQYYSDDTHALIGGPQSGNLNNYIADISEQTITTAQIASDNVSDWFYLPHDDNAGLLWGFLGAGLTAGLVLSGSSDHNAVPTTKTVNLPEVNEDSGTIIITQAQLISQANDTNNDVLKAGKLQASVGTIVDNGDGTWTLTLPKDYNGELVLNYTIDDGHGGIVTGTAIQKVAPVSDIVADEVTATEDEALTSNVLGNDTFEGTAVITSVTQGTHGTVVINGDNTITYTPDADYNGTDSYTYTVTSGGVTETATVNVTVGKVQDIAADSVTTDEDTAIITDVLTNDTFEATPAVTSVTQGTHGTVVINGDNTITYTPDADYNGTDSYTYTVTSGGVTETATVNVTVGKVQDIVADSVTTDEDTAITTDVLANDTFEATPAVTAVTQGTHGTVVINGDNTITYTPDADYNGTDSYTYTVTSGGVTETATVSVTINPINDPPVITSNGGDTTAAVNVAENSTAVTTVTSTDVDAAATATYSIIGGADASKFTIDASTGALSFVSAPDFENKLDAGADNVYDVTVQVSDGLGGADTQAIAVTVTNVNEAPVITSNGGGANATPISVSENGTAVTTVTSTDVDASATATYSIVGGADAAKFTIDASTGALSFKTGPNYESPTDDGGDNVYDVKVQVSDGSLTDTQDIAVTVTNVNEAPIISSNGGDATAAVNVAENSTAVTTVTSTDVDAAATATYSIIGGADASKFTIDASTGALSFVSAPDFENKLDAGADNVYDVTVQVSDGLGGADTQAIAVTVTNVNEAPIISSNGGDATAAVNVAENSTAVTTVTSTDVDAAATATYSIIGGADASKFTIDASTGALSFVSAPDFENKLDEGANNVYDVKVQVSDGSLIDTQDIAVTVTNVNEAPVITSNAGGTTAAVNVAENSTAVTTVTSTDIDAGATASYSIIGGADSSKFTIDASTGALSFVSAPDFENKLDAGANNVYDVTVQVSDGLGGVDSQAIAVTVTNVNEAPVITSNGGDTTAAVNVAENSTAVTTVTSTDIDAGATATYSIIGGADAAKFTIDASTGALSFVSAPNYESPTDAGGNNVYDVKVQVSDGSLTDTQDVAVTVTNVNEAPAISSNGSGSTAAVNVAENSTAVTTVTSTDIDAGATAIYSIVGGADASKFTIDASTGALSFVSAPDFENKLDDGANNVYDVKVQVSDGTLTDTQDIAVTVTNVNEAPVITSNGGGATATPVSVSENSTAVTTVTSTDIDASATATYSIVGGADAAKFTIDASTGALSFKTGPNYESPSDDGANNVYDVKVQVSDGTLTDTQDIAVTVTNVNEAPVITSGAEDTTAVNVAENSIAVTTVTSTDIDASATATYSIIGGADASKFTIDASTGALSFVSAPDFENKLDAGADNVYDVTVQVSDGFGGADTQDIAVTVTNVNEAPVITSNAGGNTAAVNVAENSTAVTTVTSTDVDASATATYSIVGGADAAKFIIDASTGALSFKTGPNYESPSDDGGNNVYDVKVQVSDGSLTDTQGITVTVTNVNEAPVITSNAGGTTAAVNVAENSTAVTTVTSTDIDAGATATYSIIGGADASKFTIDASTGALSFVSAPDFENKLDAGADNVYDVTVQVSDGLGGVDSQAIAVTVTNVNEAPIITSNGSGTTAAVNAAENSTAVTTVTSTDIDAGATATYSIVGGADAAKFTINASTGALSFVSAPDYESPTDSGANNVYDVKVQVSDGSLTDTQDIAVTVTNVNEAPVITSNAGGNTAAVNVAENSTAVTTVTSTDVDASATATYTIVGGADAAKFIIDASTGALSFVSVPDYESPTDSGANNVYDVKVQVSDDSLTDTQDIAVTVTNVNEAPVITSNGSGTTAALSVAENSTAVTTVTSTDIDAGATATYSIVGGADAAKFTINASTGALSFVSAPDYESPTDSGANNVYDVTVQASDSLGGVDTQAIAVTVTNINEAPIITSNGSGTTAAVNAAENSTAVTTVTSTDIDAGATATYSIIGGADAAKFTIDASTGALSFVSAPNYESPTDAGGNNVYDVKVQVSDGSLTDTQDIAVTVTNVNEAPIITSNAGGTTAAVNAAENSTAVTTVTSTDIDAGATATYSIIGGADAAKFTINASTGALSFVSAPDYESPTDSGANNVYDVKVQVSDGSLTDTQDIAVTVTNVNEAPVITSNGSGSTAAVNIAENSTAVTTVTSTDIDAGATATYSIVSGADAAKFTINASTGALSFVSAPNYESPTDDGGNNVYDVKVQVSDGTLTDTQDIAVTVTNVNEAPVITSNGSGTTAAVNVAENSTAVTTVTSTDVDAGATATYSIIGGADAAKFTIDASTGALSFVSAPDFENKLDAGADNVYDVTVQVRDGLGGVDTQSIAVTVTNVNEAPVITSNGSGTTAALSVAENSTAVTTVTSTDIDAGATATYSIVGGADAAKFTINASTGALSFVSAPDYESPTDYGANNVYDVTVQASDSLGGVDTQSIAVTVTNVNEAPVITSNGSGTTAAVNVAENSTAVTTVTSTDVDAGATATYSIIGGADAAKFTIDASTGALSFVSAPDFENKLDAGADNVYDVTVQVIDGLGGVDTQAIAVTVTNVNEAPVITSSGGGTTATVNVAENSTAVTTVTSTDVDAAATAAYSIVGGADAAKFTINASTGALSFVSAPNYESPTDADANNVYDVKVQVSDGSLTDTQDIAVTVTNIYEQPVITSNSGGDTAAVNVAENSTAVTTVTSSIDSTGTGKTYSITGGADAGLFTINASTGALSFVSAPNYESPTDAGANNVYDVTVRVSDGAGGTDTQAIAVTVTNVNEVPVITSNGGGDTAAVSVAENSTAVTTVTSTDVDAGATATYSIVGGADAAKFTINASTGALSFVSTPNYESPTDSGTNNVYDVKVQVSDGSLTDTQDIAVTVTNVYEQPVITSNSGGDTASVNVAENSTAVTTVTSIIDSTGTGKTYSITGGADAALFTINASTGALSFVSAPDFENKLDAGTNNVYDVTVQASDGAGGIDTQAIAVTVTNVNEAPVITSNGGGTTAAVSVAENSTAVTTVTSTDVDAGATATYSIVGGVDSTKFNINASTGALSFKTAPNREIPTDSGSNNVYDVKVQVSDGSLTDTQDIAVTVTNVYEEPVISSNGSGTTAAVNVAENSTAVTTVTSVIDSTGTGKTYSITGGADAALFTINASTGALSFVSAPDFENKLDAGTNNVYDVTVQVSDGVGGTDTQAIAVTVTNVNEAPVITSNGGGAVATPISVAENSTAVTRVTSTDVDAGATATYSISGGVDAAKFNINSSTGELTFKTGPNYESPTDSGANNVYDVKVQVSDGSLTDTQDIAVTVTNVYEEPVISSNGSGSTAAVNVAENSTAVTNVTSVIDSTGTGKTYSITGGADASLFTINSSTGALSFVSAPDFENKLDAGTNNVYDVTVQVSDGVGGIDTQAIAVTVTNVNEAPVITSNGGGAIATPISIVENSTAVTTVTSTDVDAGATATYSIVGGADAAKFTINASTGVLSFASAPNYEIPIDSGANNVYDVKVQVSDGSLTDTQDIAVTVTNVYEQPVISGGDTATVNVAENSTTVTTVPSVIDSTGTGKTYSITGGADASLFTINSSTGALSFVSAPNYESPTDSGTNNVYDVTVQVSDGLGGVDSQAITVNVTNVNEAPVINSNGGGATAAVSVAENSTAVTTVTSTDVDAGATATYSIVGGADASLFTINSSTGALSFVSAPNYESPTDIGANNVYDVIVQASDSLGGTDTQAIVVTVTNVNEPPTITSDGGGTTASLSVAENSTLVTTVTSTDVDADAAKTYSIIGGADKDLFTINTTTGVLSFIAAPNREVPTDADGNDIYDVEVQVWDGGLADTQAIAVTVTNVYEPPVITSGEGGDTATYEISENASSVTTVNSDIDFGKVGTYTIIGGADASKFAINPATGALRFITAPNYEAPSDSDANGIYAVKVQVSDGVGGIDIQDITITVKDVNEAPIISGNGAKASLVVSENTKAVTTVTATDVDASETLTYSISGTDASLFTIDASTGALSFVNAPNYEVPADSGANNIYDVTVTVTDKGGLTSSRDMSISVANVNEAPEITNNAGAQSIGVNIAENTTKVLTVTSTDQDALAIARYSIVGGEDAAKFSINPTTGELRFINAPNYEAASDVLGDNIYNVTVQVSDTLGGTDTQSIAVTVTNVNEAPVITSNDGKAAAKISVAENSTTVTTVASTDVDAGATATYSIVGGADSAKFTIDASTGVLSFVSAPNYESPTDTGANNVYDVTVQVSDGLGGTDTQAIGVTVTNVNEAPAITSNGGAALALNVAENTTAVTTIVSNDPEGSALTYSLTGVDAARFTIDSETGVLRFIQAPNYEGAADSGTNNVYNLQVQVSDGTLTDTQDIEVTVTNVNEAPAITSNGAGSGAAVSVAENTTAVTTVTASDAEGDALIYSISGTDSALFAIDPSTGALSFVSAPNYEAPADAGPNNVYNLQVQVSDGTLTDTQALAVTVTNVNETPVISGGATAAVSIVENTRTTVTTVVASDQDAIDLNNLIYTINGGVDADMFAIDPHTGVLTFAKVPDYEFKEDVGSDNIYDVVVQVTDGRLSDTQAIAVTVTNVNEAPVITSNGGGATAALSIAENTTAVTTVRSTDVDAGATATYSITGGDDAAKFVINAPTGVLSFASAPDYETTFSANGDNIYDVQVQVSDGSLIDTQLISVTVDQVTPVIGADGIGIDREVDVNENTSTVTTVSSSLAGAVTYSIVNQYDADKFEINASTGVLSFKTAPDFETPADTDQNNVYNVAVNVTDGVGGTDTQVIAVNVTNVNEAPVITSNAGGESAAINVAENTTSVGTIQASDVDASTQLVYNIVGGADAALFYINPATGILRFINAPNFENPSSAGGNNVYDVQVQVSDGSLCDTQNIAVTVTNVNEAPEITSRSSVSVSENTTTVTTVTSFDVDAGATASYSITGGADAGLFTINASTGALSFVTAPNFEYPADAGGNNIYDVQVTVSDGSLTDTQDIAVNVTNVNEATRITSDGGQDSASISVMENTTAVTTVTSQDIDANANAIYSIVGGADASLFLIDPLSGKLRFISAPNYENKLDDGKNNVYEVTVQVSDGSLTDTQNIQVTVNDVNDAPVMTANSGSPIEISIDENTTEAIDVIKAADDDGQALTYSISGTDAALFNIDTATGALTFKASPNFEAPADADTDNVYSVNVTVSDGTLTDTQAVNITVEDANDAPVFTSGGGSGSTSVDIAENTVMVTTLAASDEDSDATQTYTIVGGADAALFSIDPSSGELQFIDVPDFEKQQDADKNNVYEVQVQVSDGTLTDIHNVSVTVTDVNEAPEITSNLGFKISLGIDENTTAVTTITASDVDLGATLKYSLVDGSDSALFTIDENTGVLSFKNSPDYEQKLDAGSDNIYDVTVQVSDGILTDTQDVSVKVNNVNEAPVLTANNGLTINSDVEENSTSVTTITSGDVDADSVLSYSISGGVDAALFAINASTGELRFIAAPDYETPADAGSDNIYNVTVQVSDGILTDTQDIVVNVTNVNEAPVITSYSGTDSAAVDINENTVMVTTVVAADVDAGQTIQYSISGTDAGLFNIDASTGVLTFKNAPNFESAGDSDANNVYDVIVQASDGAGGVDTQTIAITVNDVNENPVITSNGGGDTASVDVFENSRFVTTVSAADPDSNLNFSTLTYSLSGTDATYFTIDAATGELNFVNAPDYETDAHSYSVRVEVTDNGYLTDYQDMTINLGNVDHTDLNFNSLTTDLVLTSYEEQIVIQDRSAAEVTYDLTAGSTQITDVKGSVSGHTVEISSYANDLDGSFLTFRDGSLLKTATAASSLTGGSGNDQLIGSALADTLTGGDGNDLLTGGDGNDLLTGGTGSDIFGYDFGQNEDHDTIVDFSDGADKIHIAGGSYADLTIAAGTEASDTLITLSSGTTITLKGVAAANINADDFTFVV